MPHNLFVRTFVQRMGLSRLFPRVSAHARALTTKPTPPAAVSAVDLSPVFTPEQRQVQRLARKAALGPYISQLPEKWIPYAELMRLEKPVGTWLLYSPCTWGITMAAFQLSAPLSQTMGMLAVFGVGALVMRGAGCTINDILDRNLDNKVERTIERPITSGRVTVPQAVTFLGAQLLVGMGILLLLPLDCFLLGASSLVLVGIYPLFKRFTYYPQAVLSACFNWGTLLGFPAMGLWDWSVMIPLYVSTYAWCMTYDTIYAHQDKAFDVAAGIKSTALAWGDNSKRIFTGLTVLQMSSFAVAGIMNGLGPGFLLGGLIGGYRIFKMIKRVDLNNPADCGKWFRSNINTGHIFFAGMFIDYLLRLLGFV